MPVHLVSENIMGPYKKLQSHPLAKQNVEDPYIWSQNNEMFMIAKDMSGETVGKAKSAFLVKTDNPLEWHFEECRPAYDTEVQWEEGAEKYISVERPQIYFEEGRPICIFNSVKTSDGRAFNLARKIRSLSKGNGTCDKLVESQRCR